MSRLPDFFVVGAAKSGTTALHHLLLAHPRIYVPPRQEPSFFAFEGERPSFRGPRQSEAAINRSAVTELRAYQALYGGLPDDCLAGDVSPAYLYWPGTAHRIAQRVPCARIVIILRNPADRAYSAFMHAKRESKEPLDFAAALKAEASRIEANWGLLWRYVDLGRYARQIRDYYDVFPVSQVKVVLFERLRDEPQRLLAELYEFLDVSLCSFANTTVRYNASGVPRSRVAHYMTANEGPLRPLARLAAPYLGKERLRRWRQVIRVRNLTRVPMEQTLRFQLLHELAEDVVETGSIIGEDLSSWIAPIT